MSKLLAPPMTPVELEQIAARAAKASNAKLVVLFGSVARGEATLGSDLDLLLVLGDDANVLEAGLATERAFTPRFYPLDIVTMLERDFRNPLNPLIRDIRCEARVLYGR